MRQSILAVAAIMALSFSANAAQMQFAAPTTLPPVPDTIHDLVDRAGVINSEGVHTQVFTPHTDWVFIFPIVGSVNGGNGTFFRSETTIVNSRSIPQDAALFYFPANGGSVNCTRPSVRLHFAANTWYVWSDFVPQVFGTSGLGAVIVVAVDAAGNPDSNAILDGSSRIWTPIPGSTGSASQNFPAAAFSIQAGRQSGYGLRQDAAFRTNIGIFNYETHLRTFDINVIGLNGQTSTVMNVDACTLTQFPAPSGNFGVMAVYVQPRDTDGGWYGYASSNDNVSGDSWSATLRP